MRLDEIAGRLKKVGLEPHLSGDPAIEIRIDHLTADSRMVGPDGLFVAVSGESVDGHLFIDKAVNNGAIAIVHEAMPERLELIEDLPSGIASVRVNDSKTALGAIAAVLTGDPSESVGCIGVTGTNGKTTTSFLIYQMLEAAGYRSGLIGTIEYRVGRKRIAATHTTPDAITLQRLLASMRDDGCKFCVTEVSSHALIQRRTASVGFCAGVFTNLSRDHLDYHVTMGSYRDAKKSLFDGLSPNAVAITNADDPTGRVMVVDTQARITTYGQSDASDVHFEIVDNSVEGLTLTLDGRLFNSKLVGRFNAYNIAASYATAIAIGVEPTIARRHLENAKPVPGRFERVMIANGPTAIVDYAHTPDALKNVLTTARELSRRGARITCVFGCGGDRDNTKRPMMGAIAEELADRVIVTNDNPRTEDPRAIFAGIRGGMDRPNEAEWVIDRAAAIKKAVFTSRPNDIVVVAGKGHENYQINGTQKIRFDDREVLQGISMEKR